MSLKEIFGRYELGDEQSYKNMTIIPIIGKNESELEYIVLQEGLKAGTVQVFETGSVNTVRIKKDTKKDLLVVKGEYIIGGKQNREITVNALIEKDEINVPAHCVQHGRWSNFGDIKTFRASPSFVAASLRSDITKEGAYGTLQSHTWDSINRIASSLGAHSHTQDYAEITEAREDDVRDYVGNFSLVKGQTGIIAVITSRNKSFITYFIDSFDQASTLKKHYERLLSSYAVDALIKDNNRSASQADKAKDFLEEVLNIGTEESPSLDLGSDYEFREKDGSTIIQGSALVYKNNVVYLGAQRKRLNSLRTTGPEPFSPIPSPPVEPDPWQPPVWPHIRPRPRPGIIPRPGPDYRIRYVIPLSGRSRIENI